LHAFIEKQETINTQLAQSMTDFKDTLAKFTSALSFQEKGKFSSQQQQNPKGQYNSSASSSGSQHMDQVQSLITLHSGKVIEKPILEPCKKDDESISEGKEGVKPEHCKEKTDSPPALPFPHAITKQRKVNHNSEIFETFKQVRINIPLLDAIKHVPSYAKFLKDLCTVKRKLNVKKKAFLAKQVSVILQNNNALKYKDPGCPTISCFIGEHKIDRALLDLGASVILLPFPHAMTKQREVNHNSEIFETFKQEEIEDEKGTKNVVADHLSKLTIDLTSDITPIDDYFLDESSLSIASIP